MDNNFNNQMNNYGYQNMDNNQMNTGYQNVDNNQMNNYGYQNNNFNQPYGGQYNTYYNPVPNPPMIKRSRNTAAVLLSVLLGFIMIVLAPMIALNFGSFAGGDIREMMKSSAVRDNMQNLFMDSMMENSDIDIEVNDEVVDVAVDTIGLVFESAFKGEMPPKSEIKENFKVIFDWYSDEYIDALLDETIEKGGVLSITSGNGDVSLQEYLSNELYDYIEDDLVEEYGTKIEINKSNKSEIKKYIQEEINKHEQVFDEYIDEAYEELEKTIDDMSEDVADVSNVVLGIGAVFKTMLLILIISVIVIAVIQFLLDKNIGMTLKGFFGPFFISGLFTLLEGLGVEGISALVKVSLENAKEDTEMISMVSSFFSGISTPLLVVGFVLIVVAIIVRVIGKTLYNNSIAHETI